MPTVAPTRGIIQRWQQGRLSSCQYLFCDKLEDDGTQAESQCTWYQVQYDTCIMPPKTNFDVTLLNDSGTKTHPGSKCDGKQHAPNSGYVGTSQTQAQGRAGTSQTRGRVYSFQWSGFLGRYAKQKSELVESNRERRWVASINQGPREVEALTHHTCTSTEYGGNWETVQYHL